MASEPEDPLRWRCVACRSDNHVSFARRGEAAPEESGRAVARPVETACPHCRTRHILVGDPADLAHVAPLDEIGRRGAGDVARKLAGWGLVAAGLLGLCVAFEVATHLDGRSGEGMFAWALSGLATLAAGALLLRRPRGAEAFLARDGGLEVRGPDGRSRGLIPWEKIRGAEYRLLMGRRMALWLAVEGHDGSLPPAPLVAETGVALFTRSRAMPQFLMALAARLGDRASFVLPIVALGAAGGGRSVPLQSGLARKLVSGTFGTAEIQECFAAPSS